MHGKERRGGAEWRAVVDVEQLNTTDARSGRSALVFDAKGPRDDAHAASKTVSEYN